MIVMKFGGTSVGSAQAIQQAAQVIQAARRAEPVCVVVSAMSGITDRLIQSAQDALHRRQSSPALVEALHDHHRQTCQALQLDPIPLLRPLDDLAEVLAGVGSLRELTPRSLDRILSGGELLSSRILAAYLTREGTPAHPVTGWDAGLWTDAQHGAANLLPESYDRIAARLSDLAPSIPIVTGFLAQTEAGERTTLGRGGSDYTAAILGRALDAREIQIWTDVSGILSTDPRIVPGAHTLPELTFEEAAELAYFGAKVIHPKTIEPALKAGIPVRIKNTFEPTHPGTRIVAGRRQTQRPVVAIAAKKQNTILTLDSTRMLAAEGYLATVFDTLKAHRISVDAIATSEVSVCMTVEHRYRARLEAARPKLQDIATVATRDHRAIICVVGLGLRQRPGTAAPIFAALAQAGVNIEMISMGSSHINITFVVTDEQADHAIRALHGALLG